MGDDQEFLNRVIRRAFYHPANTEDARKHLAASGVYDPSTVHISSELCECCRMPFRTNPFSLWCNTDDLVKLGIAFPLLFYYTKCLACLLCIVLVLSAVPEFVYNVYLYSEEKDTNRSWLEGTTVGGGVEYIADFPYWPVALNFVTVICLCVATVFVSRCVQEKTKALKTKDPTPANYCILIRNLSENCTASEVLEDIRARVPHAEAVYLSFCCREYFSKGDELSKLLIAWSENAHSSMLMRSDSDRILVENAPSERVHTDEESTREIREQVEKLITERKNLKNPENLKNIGTAICAFRDIETLKIALNNFTLSAISEACYWVAGKNYPYHKNGRDMSVSAAPEPSDIIWENFEYKRLNRLVRHTVGYIALFGLLGLSFGLLFLLADWESDRNSRESGDKSSQFPIPPAAIIVLFNILLLFLISGLAVFECHYTQTKKTLSVASKLTIILSVNTLLFPFLVCVKSEKGYSAAVLGSKIFWVSVTTVISTFIRVFHPLRLMRLARKCVLNWELHRGGFATQMKANLLHQQEQFDLADCYSDQMIRFLLAITYCPIVPLVIPVTLAGYLVDYWANKWLLLRWSCRPKGVDEKIAMRMLLFLNPAVVLYAVTTLLAFRQIRTDMQAVGGALCALSVLFSLFNFYCGFCNPQPSFSSSVGPDHAALRPPAVFPTQTYESTNPMTQVIDEIEDLRAELLFQSLHNPRVRVGRVDHYAGSSLN